MDDLYGGTGADRFLFSLYDLFDDSMTSTVRDADETDRLYLSGTSIDQIDFIVVGENRWLSADGSIQLKIAGGLVIQAINGGVVSEGKIVITDFSNGKLGLNLPNRAPLVADQMGDQQATQDQAFNLVLPESLFSDPDGDALTFSVRLENGSQLPSWLAYDPATRTLTGTPGNDDVGNLSIKVIATDTGGLSTYQVFGIDIANVNDAPEVMASLADQEATEGDLFSFTLPAVSFRDIDKDDVLTYSATLANGLALPSWLSFNAATGVLNGTPSGAETLSVKITATDLEGKTASQVFALTVAAQGDTNHAPEVNDTLQNQTATQNQLFRFVLPASLFADSDGDALTYKVMQSDGSALPSWLAFDAATLTLSGRPANGDVGYLNLKVMASDADGLSAEQYFGLEIANVNDAPTPTRQMPVQRATEYQAFSFALGGLFADPDGDSFTQSVTLADGSPLPSWLHYNAETGTVSGVAGERSEPIALRLTATDALGGSSSQQIWLQIQSDPSRHPDENVIQVNAGIPNGTVGNDHIESTSSGIFYTHGGNDTIITNGGIAYGGGGDDTIFSTNSGIFNGEAGNDRIVTHGGIVYGGIGDDVIESRRGGGIYDGGEGNDRITMMGGIANGGNGNDVIISSNGGILFGDDGDDYIESNGGILEGGNGNDTLVSNRGGFNGGQGDDLLISTDASYSDYYRLNVGEGHDRIRDARGSYDSLSFGCGISNQQLWFSREGDNLRIDYIGSNDGMTIEGWYSDNGQHQIERVYAGGRSLALGQVDSLVQAMAAFAPPAAGQSPLPADYQAALNPVIAASWR